MFALSPQLSCEGSEAVSSIGFVSSRKREHLKRGFGFWALHLPCPTLVNSDSDVLREKASLRFDGKEVDSSDMRNSGLRLCTRSAFTVMNPPISWVEQRSRKRGCPSMSVAVGFSSALAFVWSLLTKKVEQLIQSCAGRVWSLFRTKKG